MPVSESHRLRLKTLVFSLIVILSNVFGNTALAHGMKQQGADVNPIAALFQPWVALGVALLILWMLSRMTLLSWADLSFVLPVTAFGYVLTAVSGQFLLGETLTAKRWAGTLLIVAGVTLVGFTSPRTEGKP